MLRGLEQGPVVRVLGPYVVSGGWWNRRGPPRLPLRRDPARRAAVGLLRPRAPALVPAGPGGVRRGLHVPTSRCGARATSRSSKARAIPRSWSRRAARSASRRSRSPIATACTASSRARQGARARRALIVGSEVTLDDGSTPGAARGDRAGYGQPVPARSRAGGGARRRGRAASGWHEVCEHAAGRARAVGRRAQPARRRGRSVLRRRTACATRSAIGCTRWSRATAAPRSRGRRRACGARGALRASRRRGARGALPHAARGARCRTCSPASATA